MLVDSGDLDGNEEWTVCKVIYGKGARIAEGVEHVLADGLP